MWTVAFPTQIQSFNNISAALWFFCVCCLLLGHPIWQAEVVNGSLKVQHPMTRKVYSANKVELNTHDTVHHFKSSKLPFSWIQLLCSTQNKILVSLLKECYMLPIYSDIKLWPWMTMHAFQRKLCRLSNIAINVNHIWSKMTDAAWQQKHG